jgi:hypothetical protein
MRALLLLSILLASVPSVFAQAKDASSTNDPTPLWIPTSQNFPPLRASNRGPKAHPLTSYTTDYIWITNYGQVGTLIMGLGDQFSGIMATFSVCDKWAIRGLSGTVDWHDRTPPTQLTFGPLLERHASTVKTPQQSGTFPVTVQINGLCDSWYEHGIVPNSVTRTATAYVYESIPLSTFQLNCTAGSPCPSIKGGGVVSGVVTNVDPATGLGTLVLIKVDGPGGTVPYVIETVGLNTVSFDIQTTPVTANTQMLVTVFSGGTTLTQVVTVTP